MADYYHRHHVRELLKHRKILFLGDSNIRSFYKDFLCAIRKHGLPKVKMLSGFDSINYCEDKIIQSSGTHNDWNSWEHRLYEKSYFRIEMFFMGQITSNAEDYFLERLRFSYRQLPNVVYVSFSPRLLSDNAFPRNNNSHSNTALVNFLERLKALLPINTMFILGSGCDGVQDFFGNPCFDEIPFPLNGVSLDKNGNCENTMKRIASLLEFHCLNVAYYHRQDVFRGITSHPGWQIVTVRYTTCLLLTYIAMNLSLKLPNKVSQETLRKAIAETQADNEEYRRLLLRLPCDWEGAKQINTATRNDSAAENAHELMCILWSQLQRSSFRRSSRAEKALLENSASNQNLGSRGKQLDRLEDETVSSSSSVRGSTIEINQKTIRSSPETAARSAALLGSPVEEKRYHQDDDLEEGEIREPSPDKTTQNHFSTTLDDVSDIDSSESNYSDGGTFEPSNFFEGSRVNDFLPRALSRSRCLDLPEIYDGRNDVSSEWNPPVNSCVPDDLIEISDDEPTKDNDALAVPVSIVPVTCVISSDESDTELETSKNFPSTRNGAKSIPEKIEGLTLIDRQGKAVPWPINIADKGAEKLWRWWKKYLSDNNGVLTLRYPGLPDVHAKTPRLGVPRGDYLVLPKIIDDLAEFLKIVKSIPIPSQCLKDSNPPREGHHDENQSDEKDNNVQDQPALPSPEKPDNEPSHRRIAFSFPQKRSASNSSISPTPPNIIRVRSFASISNITRHSQSKQHRTINLKQKKHSHLPDVPRTQRSTTQSVYSPFGPWVISNDISSRPPEYRSKSTVRPVDYNDGTAHQNASRRSHNSKETSFHHRDGRLGRSYSCRNTERKELPRRKNYRERSRSP